MPDDTLSFDENLLSTLVDEAEEAFRKDDLEALAGVVARCPERLQPELGKLLWTLVQVRGASENYRKLLKGE